MSSVEAAQTEEGSRENQDCGLLGTEGDDGGHDGTGEQHDGASRAHSVEPSKPRIELETFCAGLISDKSRVYRNFRRTWEALKREFEKENPSARYLLGDLQRAEGLVSGIRERIEQQKESVISECDYEKLSLLEAWEQRFDMDVELLADVSAWIERRSERPQAQESSLTTSPIPSQSALDELTETLAATHTTGATGTIQTASNDPVAGISTISSPWGGHVLSGHHHASSSVSGRPDISGPSPNGIHPSGQHPVYVSGSSLGSSGQPVQSAFQPVQQHAPVCASGLLAGIGTSFVDTQPLSLTVNPVQLPPPPASNVVPMQSAPPMAMSYAYTITSSTGQLQPPTGPRPSVMQPPPQTSSVRARPGALQPVQGQAAAYQPMPVPSLPPFSRPPGPIAHASVAPSTGIRSYATANPSAMMSMGTQSVLPAPVQPPGQYPPPHYPHLQPLKVPRFGGLEKDYLQWRQRFLRTVDCNPWTSDDHKLDRLRESTEGGKAESLVAGVIDGPGAYQEAWQQLEAWYGGQDRHLEKQIRSVMDQRKITSETDYGALQEYAVRLQNTLSSLKICGTQPGTELYLLATERVPKELLMKFFAQHGEHTSDVQLFSTWLVGYLRTMKRAADRVSGSTRSNPPGQSTHHQPGHGRSQPPRQQRTMLSSDTTPRTTASTTRQCRKCQRDHGIDQCPEFKALPVTKRWDLVRLLNLCSCCLTNGHWASDCRKGRCSRCSGAHHDLLHRPPKPRSEGQSDGAGSRSQHVTNAGNKPSSSVTFMTVNVKLKESRSRKSVTALLDSGSNCSYVTKELATRLGLSGPTESIETTVLGGDVITANCQRVTIHVCHDGSPTSTAVSALVIPNITSHIEAVDWNQQKHAWPHLEDIDFVTPRTNRVDVLIGLDAAELHVSYEERRTEGGPIARRTPLGWICFGPQSTSTTTLLASESDDRLDSLVKKMWDLEAVGMDPPPGDYLTPAEKEAEQLTADTMSYDGERYQMGIPWLGGRSEPDVHCERAFAERRLNSLVASLKRKPEVKIRYAKVLEDYLAKGYIQRVPDEVVAEDGHRQWFLPHFPVVRENKATTKVRVVFDAAAECKGTSINGKMHTGPKLQNDMVKVLLRFCAHPVALAGDVSEMFLQVRLRPEDRKFHRFLWREEPGSPVVVFEFLRLAFGMRASPYLAGRALKATADDADQQCSPSTKAAIHESFYVDDFLHSLPTAPIATETRAEVQEVVGRGGFRLTKWISNNDEVMNAIPPEQRSQANAMSINEHDGTAQSKTLGVTWSPGDDSFSFAFPVPKEVSFTRRGVLRQLARLFDPRGQLQPFTIRSRVLFQEVCIRGKGWDEPLDEDHRHRWQRWFDEFEGLATVSIERSFRSPGSTAPLTIHTFVDASEYAYAAAVYVREGGDLPRITLAMARARPTPIKKRSIPMLELQGAVLGVRVARTVAEALGIAMNDCVYWTDSMNVLYWVRSPSRRFKMDVGRRIAEIQESSASRLWNHVPGTQNPADKATRGLAAEQLAADEVWFHGPQYLAGSPESWPQREIQVPAELPGLTKSSMPATFIGVAEGVKFRLQAERYSSWRRLTRVTAWCFRVIGRRRAGLTGSRTDISVGSGKSVAVPELSPEELDEAERYWIQRAQREAYPSEFHIVEGSDAPHSGPLVKLRPVIDNSMSTPILRVGGRLKEARHLPPNLRSPIILPRQHHVTRLIIRAEDDHCNHAAGTNHLLSNLASRYWIVKGRAAVKEHRTKCVLCKKRRSPPVAPLMAPLPDFRTSQPLRAFTKVGVDYAGPFLTRQGRGRVQTKRYVCVFTCMQTRACHLELVYSLDTDGLLMALARFSKRRGTPREIVSDNGSNLVAADKELRTAVESLDSARIASQLASQQITWRFNPPAAPHFGGAFETMVKSMKRVLQNVLYRASLTDEELHTTLVQAEALINSRPLTTVSTDAEDLTPLTPQHFLVGHSEMVLPTEESADADDVVHPNRRWKYIQSLLRMTWQRWLHEIVPKLNVRHKWLKEARSVAEGDVLMVMEKGTPRSHWPLGRVTGVHPGRDGTVRVVDIKIRGKIYRRPVHIMIPLETEPDKADG